jgi:hypothetical protein
MTDSADRTESVADRPKKFALLEREPLRWLAAQYTQNAFLRIDNAGKGGKAKPMDATFAQFLGRH